MFYRTSLAVRLNCPILPQRQTTKFISRENSDKLLCKNIKAACTSDFAAAECSSLFCRVRIGYLFHLSLH